MPRKATENFLKSVLSSVSSEPKSILEIAKNAGTSWESTKDALNFLVSLGVIESKQEGNRKLFFKRNFTEDTYNKTWFNIPLEPRDENIINFIFETARKMWKEKTRNDISKTQMQKVLINVNYICNLDLPVGRYLYGMICIKPFEPTEVYRHETPENNQQIINAISLAVNKYSKLSLPKLKALHYSETNNRLYQAKEESLCLACSEFNKNNFSNFCKSLSNIIVNMPAGETEITELFIEFIGIVNNLSQVNERELMLAKNDVISTFNEIWKAIATKLFFNDMLKKYSNHQLMKLGLEFFIQMQIANEYVSRLDEFILKKNYPKCPEYEELKKLQGSIKEIKILTEEELQKLAEESAKDSSKVFREFGLD